MPPSAAELLHDRIAPAPSPERGHAGAAGLLVWVAGAEGRNLSQWRIAAFGPAVEQRPAPPWRLRLEGADRRFRDIEDPGLQWRVVAPPGAALQASGWATRQQALEALAGANQPALLIDSATGGVDLVNGAAAGGPLFIRAGRDLPTLVFSDLPALRRYGLDLQPRAAAVSHLLAFGQLPPDGTMLNGIEVVQPGETLALHPVAGATASVRAATARFGETEVPDALAALLAPAVRGQRVAIGCLRQGAAAHALAQAARDAGAARVVMPGPEALPPAIDVLQSVVIALGCEPFGDAGLLLDAGLALAASEEAEVVLLPWGGETWLPSRPELHRFAATLDGLELENAPLRSLAGGFLRTGRFARDIFFDEIAVFPDDDRLQIIGPALFAEGFRALADELGDGLEELDPQAALLAAARLDERMGVRRTARSLLPALRRQSPARLMAPFLDAGLPGLRQAAPAGIAGEAILRGTDIATDRLATALGPHSAVFALGLLSRGAPALTLLTQGEGGTPRQRAQALVLLALEKWLRVIGAGI